MTTTRRTLIVLAVLIALPATVQLGWRSDSARADVVAGDFCLDELSLPAPSPGEPECAGEAADGFDAMLPPTFSGATTQVYEINVTPLSATTVGNIGIIVTFGVLVDIDNVNEDFAIPIACLELSDGLSCELGDSGPVLAGTAGVITFQATLFQDFQGGTGQFTVYDLGGGWAPGNDQRDGVVVTGQSGGGLRHIDSDADAFYGPLDSDGAVGALHAACAVGFGLTAADNAFLQWSILATELSPTVANLLWFSGNDWNVPLGDIPCIQWRSGAVGDQAIFAEYDADGSGPNPSETLHFDGTGGEGATQPLVQEWNSIDVTRLVSATGTVQISMINNGSSEVANLDAVLGTSAQCVRSRDAFVGDVNCSDRPNVDGQTVGVAGPVTKGKLGTAKQSFIDYTFGSHTDHYNGPIDGAEQTYTYVGCGSIRLEDPVSGTSHLLTPASRSATVLTSNYGVAFTVFSTSDGLDLAPDGSNASCRVGNRTKVMITTSQDVVLTSVEDTAPDETVTIKWERQR